MTLEEFYKQYSNIPIDERDLLTVNGELPLWVSITNFSI